MKISVCLIVKDEEKVIERCLNCVTDFADEIIVVDTGSHDERNLPIKYMILYGMTIFRRQGIMHFQRRRAIICSGLTQMTL